MGYGNPWTRSRRGESLRTARRLDRTVRAVNGSATVTPIPSATMWQADESEDVSTRLPERSSSASNAASIRCSKCVWAGRVIDVSSAGSGRVRTSRSASRLDAGTVAIRSTLNKPFRFNCGMVDRYRRQARRRSLDQCEQPAVRGGRRARHHLSGSGDRVPDGGAVCQAPGLVDGYQRYIPGWSGHTDHPIVSLAPLCAEFIDQ